MTSTSTSTSMPLPHVVVGGTAGLPVWACERSAVPLLRAALRVLGEPGSETATVREGGPAGAATSWAAMTALDRADVRERVAALAAEVQVLPDPHGLTLTLAVAADDAGGLLALVRKLISTTDAPSGSAAQAATRRLAALATVEASQAGSAARRAALALLHGDAEPLAEPLPTNVQNASWWSSAAVSAVTLVGDAHPEGLVAVFEVPPAPERVKTRIAAATGPGGWTRVPRPRSEQSAIRVAFVVPGPGDRHRAEAEVLDRLLGAGRTSRLRVELREKRGWGYHPASALVDCEGVSRLELEADVAADVTAPAVQVVRDVLASLAMPVPEEELDQARQSVLADLRGDLDTQTGTAARLSALAAAGLGADHLASHLQALAEVTAEGVAALARVLMAPGRVAAAVAGDPRAIEGALPA